jgi:PAS domain S-box-containing protein
MKTDQHKPGQKLLHEVSAPSQLEADSAELARRDTLDAMHESEQRLKMVLKAANAGAWSYDLKNKISYRSEEARRIVGVDLQIEDVSNELWLERIHVDDREFVLSKSQQMASEGKPFDMEFRVIHPDGSVHWVQNIGQYTFDDEGEAERAFGIILDVTERKRSEEKLLKLNRAYRMLSYCNQAVIWAEDEMSLLHKTCNVIVDYGQYRAAWVAVPQGEPSRLLSAIAAAGCSKDEIEQAELTWDDTLAVSQTGNGATSSYVLRDMRVSNGRPGVVQDSTMMMSVPLAISGDRFAVLQIFTTDADGFSQEEINALVEVANNLNFAVTTMRMREQREDDQAALYEANEKFSHLADNIHEGFYLFDIQTKRILYTNRAYQTLFVRLGNVYQDIDAYLKVIHPDDRMRIMTARQPQREGEATIDEEFRFERIDGSIGYARVHGFFVRDNEGKPFRAGGLVEDITERKLAEQREHELRLRAETLASITLSLTSHISIDDLLDEVLEQAHRFVPYKTANIALLEGDELVIKHWRGYEDENFIRNLRHPLSQNPIEVEMIGSRKGVVIHDTQADPRWYVWDELKWIRSFVGVPIVLHDRVLGVLRFDSENVGQYTEQDVERLLPLSHAAALALENARLYERAQQEIAAHKQTQDNLQTLNYELEQRVRLRTQEFMHAKERVEVILDSSSDGFFFAYPDSGIQQANRAFNMLFGCNDDDYFERPVTSLVRPQDHLLLAVLLEAVMEDGATRRLEIVMVRKDGTLFDAEIGIAHMKLSQKDEGVVCSLRDVTLRKRIEAALRTSEAQVRALLDGTYTYLGLLEPNGKFVLANKAALQGVGMTDADEIVGQFIWDSPWWKEHENSRERLKDAVRRATQGEFVRYEDEQWGLNGTVTMDFSLSPIKDEQGQVVLLVPEGRDISEIKRAENALSQTKNQLQAILDNSSALIYVTDLQKQIVLINRHYEEVFGIKLADLEGKRAGLFSEETLAQLRENDRQVLESGKTLEFEEVVPLPDGVHTYISIKSPLMDDSGKPYAICGISTDITERKIIEEQLRDNANLLNKVSDAIISTDVNFVIRSWNRAAQAIYGWTAEEAIGKQVTQLLDTRFPSGVTTEHVLQRFLTEGYWTGEAIQSRKDGSTVYILGSVALFKDENGVPIGSVAVNHDITERRQSEEAIKRSDADLRSIFDSTPLALILLDTDLKIRAANVIAQLFFQFIFERDGAIGDDFRQYRLLSEFEDTPKGFQEILAGESLNRDVSSVIGQTTYYFHVTYNPVVTGDGNIVGICITGEDITERKHAENELWQALEKQKELSELKSRFVSIASHEFRTPLATIQAASDALKSYMNKMTPEQITHRLNKIQSQIKHMVQLLNDVLTLEQIQVGKLQFQPNELDLVAFCRDVVDELHSDRSPRIVFDCVLETLNIDADDRLMRQVVVNILTNALKYSPEDKPVDFSLRVEGEMVALKIRDYGIGIPEKDQEHLFEPFYRATNVGTTSGSGLGLVLAKQAVELHSGSMTFVSESGIGTTFTVLLPRIGEYKR